LCVNPEGHLDQGGLWKNLGKKGEQRKRGKKKGMRFRCYHIPPHTNNAPPAQTATIGKASVGDGEGEG